MLELLPADLQTITIGGLGLSTFLMLVTQALKGFIPDKWANFKVYLPFIFGLLASFALMPVSTFSSLFSAVLVGLFFGIAATGEYRMIDPVK